METDWSHALTCRRMPRIPKNSQKLGEKCGGDSPLELPERNKPTQQLDFRPWGPELRVISFFLNVAFFCGWFYGTYNLFLYVLQ